VGRLRTFKKSNFTGKEEQGTSGRESEGGQPRNWGRFKRWGPEKQYIKKSVRSISPTVSNHAERTEIT